MSARHIPVLLDRVLATFAPVLAPNAPESNPLIFIDCTLGLGGHSGKILESYPHVQLIGIDQDAQAIAIARENLAKLAPKFPPILFHDNFAQGIESAFEYARSCAGRVVGILADIGVSSLQLDDPARGFGFQSDRLDMRMDSRLSSTASDIIALYGEFALGEILREFGEIAESAKMARLIKEFAMSAERDANGLYSAREFSDFLAKHFRSSRGRIHPATLVFQALRIKVNSELSVLKSLLESIAREMDSSDSVLCGGRRNTSISCCSSGLHNTKSALDIAQCMQSIVGIISFHSLEDRIVKDTFKLWSKSCICDEHVLRCACGDNHAKGTILTKKPIVASEEELRANPRARSAKFRAFSLQLESKHQSQAKESNARA